MSVEGLPRIGETVSQVEGNEASGERHSGRSATARVASGRREGQGARPVVFLFPGLGDQHAGMARDLYEAEPVFRAEVDRCAEKLAPLLGADLREVMFPRRSGGREFSPAGGAAEAARRRSPRGDR